MLPLAESVPALPELSLIHICHVDQAQSMNLYITNDFTMRQVLDLYLLAWRCGVKTIY